MPHLRNRHLTPALKKFMKYSPIVGIVGHRQVGKTTLGVEMSSSYVTLDDPTQLDLAENDPNRLLSGHPKTPFCIDECQYAPPLFPALKEWVRTTPKPGQFLLTGSVRFTSRKAIRESLTGRIITAELLPMDLSEANSAKLPSKIPHLLNSKSLDIKLDEPSYFSEKTMKEALEKGGLPGIFSIRNTSIFEQRFETQVNTILERDLKLITPTTLGYRTLRNLAVQLALTQGQPLEWESLHRATRISVPTLRKLISALESIFMIRVIDSIGTEKKPVLFMEDQGEATYLCGGRYSEIMDLTRFLFSQLRAQIHYRPELKIKMTAWKNRGGAHVPLCFEQRNSFLGIIPSLEESPDSTAMASARSFIKKFQNGKILIAHPHKKDVLIHPSIRSLPIGKLI